LKFSHLCVKNHKFLSWETLSPRIEFFTPMCEKSQVSVLGDLVPQNWNFDTFVWKVTSFCLGRPCPPDLKFWHICVKNHKFLSWETLSPRFEILTPLCEKSQVSVLGDLVPQNGNFDTFVWKITSFCLGRPCPPDLKFWHLCVKNHKSRPWETLSPRFEFFTPLCEKSQVSVLGDLVPQNWNFDTFVWKITSFCLGRPCPPELKFWHLCVKYHKSRPWETLSPRIEILTPLCEKSQVPALGDLVPQIWIFHTYVWKITSFCLGRPCPPELKFWHLCVKYHKFLSWETLSPRIEILTPLCKISQVPSLGDLVPQNWNFDTFVWNITIFCLGRPCPPELKFWHLCVKYDCTVYCVYCVLCCTVYLCVIVTPAVYPYFETAAAPKLAFLRSKLWNSNVLEIILTWLRGVLKLKLGLFSKKN
jgi:hypothetical protein